MNKLGINQKKNCKRFGELLKKIRIVMKKNMTEMAEFIGISLAQLSKMESGKIPSLFTLQTII